ncbi:hypothetical protein ACHHV8_25655 [Paenibacillus sp. TAB 01]|uniref:DUF7667 family protein n=1 Tax=Paenibacillus sp. TAB 01 TaxID=3368988 RepID=UPI003753D6E1
MVGIHPVHRRLAELTLKAKKLGGLNELSQFEQRDLYDCLLANLALAWRIDELKALSFIAYTTDDTEWQHDICKQLDDLTATMR